jgi:hypothetical protein
VSRLTLHNITEATAHLPAPERQDARILLACQLIRRELRAIRRDLARHPEEDPR